LGFPKLIIRASFFVFCSLLILAACASRSAIEPAATSGPLALEVAIHENRVDGCTGCGCQLKDVVQEGETSEWWMTFGNVRDDDDKGWQRVGPSGFSYCGIGNYRTAAKLLQLSGGVPYLIVQAKAGAKNVEPGQTRVKLVWSIRTFDEFRQSGNAKYVRREFEQDGLVDDVFDSVVWLLDASTRERNDFGILGLVATARISPLGQREATYGKIEVGGDFPGAWIILDGTPVGRVKVLKAYTIDPVVTGSHTVVVRDFSGREVKRTVQVDVGKSVALTLNLLDRLGEETFDGLNPLGANAFGYEEFWRPKDGAVMVEIPAGDFIMGTDKPDSSPDERPAHTVYLDDYLVDKTEVTWRQFRKFTDATGLPLPPEPLWGRPDDYPLSSIAWDEARDYCTWVGGRLPTEAEWEKAARGVDGRDYPWGDKWDPTRCNSISGGLHRPESVGSYPACVSPYGVLDMAGSHWQWVSDYYGAGYYAQSPARNPGGPEQGTSRVERGGYWMSHPEQLKVTRRGKSAVDWRNSKHGFRCARSVAGAQQ
jgi:formylglycine-generating enzyme required for sulfatase activity